MVDDVGATALAPLLYIEQLSLGKHLAVFGAEADRHVLAAKFGLTSNIAAFV